MPSLPKTMDLPRTMGRLATVLALVGALHVPAAMAETEEKLPPPAEMTAEYLARDDVVATGKTVWAEQCRHCHGKNAYPGKAPKLKVKRLRDRPDFVWDRVANGFRKMPAWRDVYTPEEIMGVVAYISHKSFSP